MPHRRLGAHRHALGQVVSIRWRYMAIATIENETIVIPNANVMKDRITVIARRGEESNPWRRLVPFDVEFEFPPALVITHVQKALSDAQISFVGANPRPSVACIGFKESGVEYEVAYDLTDPSHYWSVDSQIRVHVYVALMREGFVIPFPWRIVEIRRDERPALAQREIEHRIAASTAMDLFASLTTQERIPGAGIEDARVCQGRTTHFAAVSGGFTVPAGAGRRGRCRRECEGEANQARNARCPGLFR